jgi:hypothetical protein
MEEEDEEEDEEEQEEDEVEEEGKEREARGEWPRIAAAEEASMGPTPMQVDVPMKAAFDDPSLLDDLTDDDGGNRDSNADLDNWPLDWNELEGLPFMRLQQTSPPMEVPLGMASSAEGLSSSSSSTCCGAGGLSCTPSLPPNLHRPPHTTMMEGLTGRGARLCSSPPGGFPLAMRTLHEATGGAEQQAPPSGPLGWTTEDGYLVDDSNRDSSTTIASEELEGFGGGADGCMDDMYRFLPWMDVDPPNGVVEGGSSGIMTIDPSTHGHSQGQGLHQQEQQQQQQGQQLGGEAYLRGGSGGAY